MQLLEAVESFVSAMGGGVKSAATVKWYRHRLTALCEFVGGAALADVAVEHLRHWCVALAARELTPYTVHGYLRAARRLFRWCVDEGLLVKSPAVRLKMPQLPKRPCTGIAERDVERILSAARLSVRDYALLNFLASTGCRAGGVSRLRLEDLDLPRLEARVFEKGNKWRTVFLTEQAAAALTEWLAVRDSVSEFVFVGRREVSKKSGRVRDTALSTFGVYGVCKKWAEAAGVAKKWNPHNWRHGFARSLLRRGANLGQVSQMLGHGDIVVTQTFYGGLEESDLKAAHRRFMSPNG